jgi:hypothetical protein
MRRAATKNHRFEARWGIPSQGSFRLDALLPKDSPFPLIHGDSPMRFSSKFRVALVGVSSAAHADSGTVWIRIVKGGWFIGGAGGRGMLTFPGGTIRCRLVA